jgi:hypothetical protein
MATVALGFAAAAATGTFAASSGSQAVADRDNRVVMRDNCDPNDPAWEELGGCFRQRGTVTVEEFGAELDSSLAAAVVGHPSWRNDPPYLVLGAGETLRVRNDGGRPHSFTEVAEFGGGIVPDLNEGLEFAPECSDAVIIGAGGSFTIPALESGNHRFMCCIHPWMRAVVSVT